MNPGRSDLASAIDVLASQGWFSQRSNATRARLGAIAKLRNFAKDEMVYLAGDAPNGVFGLVSGSLNISFPRSDGEDYTLHRAGSGFWVGDLALFSSGVRLVSVRAAEPSLMVHLPVRDLEAVLRDEPSLYADFYALTYENFKTAFRIISNLGFASTEKRLADRHLRADIAAAHAPVCQCRSGEKQLWPDSSDGSRRADAYLPGLAPFCGLTATLRAHLLLPKL